MNSLQNLNILKNDPFTKTVFTDVLISDRLPREIRKRPRRYILNTDPSDKPGAHWVAVCLQKMERGNFGIRMVRLLDFTVRGRLLDFTELYSIFGQALRYIYVEQKNFARPFIRRVWTIYIILCLTSM
jgi:hypothetical protein